jgi:hypothetical protein
MSKVSKQKHWSKYSNKTYSNISELDLSLRQGLKRFEQKTLLTKMFAGKVDGLWKELPKNS